MSGGKEEFIYYCGESSEAVPFIMKLLKEKTAEYASEDSPKLDSEAAHRAMMKKMKGKKEED